MMRLGVTVFLQAGNFSKYVDREWIEELATCKEVVGSILEAIV